MRDSNFTINLHHGGRFCDNGYGLVYLGGMVFEEMHFNLDQWPLQEVVSELKQLSYKGCAKLCYCEPDCQLSTGLRELMSDGDAMRMSRFLVSQDVKHCFVYDVDEVRVEVEVEGELDPSSKEDRFDDSVDDGDHEDYFDFAVEDEPFGATSNVFGGMNDPLNEESNKGVGENEEVAANEGVDANDQEDAAGEESEGGTFSMVMRLRI
ncbi:hypothetical protein PIB30_077539 [Stylosanthes scabra]|uniref:PB1-like domain-containing protein n=1 Tax=Stylosanthes scabra TaxID=79078 RepID=A0ABU6VP27_9FABA|nr:hypothetical protein [Stylosanthes scabra]